MNDDAKKVMAEFTGVEAPGVKKPDNRSQVQILLDGLAAGECKGVGGSKAYKIAEYAKEKGLI